MTEFYNTISASGKQLATGTKIVKTQSEKLLELFDKYQRLAPYQIEKLYFEEFGEHILVGSIAGRLTDMTTEGLIIKTDKLVMGNYGMPQHTWQLAGIEMPEPIDVSFLTELETKY